MIYKKAHKKKTVPDTVKCASRTDEEADAAAAALLTELGLEEEDQGLEEDQGQGRLEEEDPNQKFRAWCEAEDSAPRDRESSDCRKKWQE